MSWRDYARAAIHGLAGRPLRTALTLLGVVVGAGSLVLISGLLQCTGELMLQRSQDATEADLVRVSAAAPPHGDIGRTWRPLSRDDAEALRGVVALHHADVVAEAARPAIARVGMREKAVTIVGGEPPARGLYRLTMSTGRFIENSDGEARRRVCVVGDEVWHELLDGESITSARHVFIGGQGWRVVGVLAPKPSVAVVGGDTNVWDRKIIIPAATFDAVFSPHHETSAIFIRLRGVAHAFDDFAAVDGRVRALLLARHFGVASFRVAGHDAAARHASLVARVIRMLVVGSALLSLFVGGINIMNIMLVTVSERTRDIGIRRALGASAASILLLFLVEAVLLSVVGGVVGIGGGVAVAGLIALVMKVVVAGWTMHVTSWSVGLALILSLATGIGFGMLPAYRAARMQPVAALRHA